MSTLTTESYEKALKQILPLLEASGITWWIAGGFACYVYGVARLLTDIDIDLHCSYTDKRFRHLYKSLSAFHTQELIHLVDDEYDNYNFEATILGVVLDFCSSVDHHIRDTDGAYVSVYDNSLPLIELVEWRGITLPVLAKDEIIKHKSMMSRPGNLDKQDIEGLEKLL